MVRNIGQKRSKIILFVYLILVLISSSAISTRKAFYLEQSNSDSMGQGRYYSSTNHNIDWLTRVTIRKYDDPPNSMQRNKLFRIFTFTGIIAIAMYLVRSNLKIIKNHNIPIIKYSIPMKLRTWYLFFHLVFFPKNHRGDEKGDIIKEKVNED